MILSNGDIKRAIEDGGLVIDPLPPPESFSTSAVDLRVGKEFRRWKKPPTASNIHINLSNVDIPSLAEFTEVVEPGDNGCVAIRQQEFLLAKTLESIKLPVSSCLAARVEGRSGFARLGLAVHITAPIIHAGFEGPIVLEIKNLGPFVLEIKPGETRLCQIIFERLNAAPEGPLQTGFMRQQNVLGTPPPDSL